jgi:hypothetical protein
MLRRVAWVSGALVALVVGGLVLRSRSHDKSTSAAATADAPEGAANAPRPENIDLKVGADKRSPEERLAEVERVIAERNAKNTQTATFEKAGWKIVTDVAPPDRRLGAYDPALIKEGREKELRTQLASTVPLPGDAQRVYQVALQAQDPSTRESAVDALGRIQSEEAQTDLMDLVTSQKTDDRTRLQAVALIRPKDLDDPVAARMASLLDAKDVGSIEKQQLAFTLALVSMRDGMALPDTVISAMSPDALALVDSMKSLAQRGVTGARHAN